MRRQACLPKHLLIFFYIRRIAATTEVKRKELAWLEEKKSLMHKKRLTNTSASMLAKAFANLFLYTAYSRSPSAKRKELAWLEEKKYP